MCFHCLTVITPNLEVWPVRCHTDSGIFRGACAVEPTLVVVGLNHRTAGVEVRERFWMSGCRQAQVLSMLSQGEGIEEVLVFSTCNRTEFVVWGDATLAVNSILRLLTAEYDLRSEERRVGKERRSRCCP